VSWNQNPLNALCDLCQVLSRREEEGVGMEDLDQLQLELESLLSAVAIRLRLLQNEIQATNNSEAQRDCKVKAVNI